MQWNEFQSYIRHFAYQDQERLKEAFYFGEKAHEGQVRFSGEPYFNHPIAVAKTLADMGADADTLIAALLHDTVEDTSLTLKKIDEKFDGKVASLIDGVTKLYAEDLQDHKEIRTLDEKIETLRKMFTFLEKDVRIMVIKLADRLHNMQTIEFFPKEKQQTYAQDTLDIYVKIAERLSMLDMREELEYLCLAVLEPALLKSLVELRSTHEQQAQQVIRTMQEKIGGFVRNPPVRIEFAQKPWHKLRLQLEAGGGPVTGISDLGMFFICKDNNACYQALGILHQLWPREQLSFQDFINAPMVNGYQGLHTTVILENGMRIRCKIRSEEMQTYAHRGITTKCFDSKATGLLEYLPWTKHISTLSQDTTDKSQEFWESLQSDILGESIIVHSSDSQTIMLPEGATVLDGAFYCYGNNALSLKSIMMDGKDVPLYTPLQNGASLAIEVSRKKTVNHDWLRYANTGLATANIRTALSSRSAAKKIQLGRQLLQDVFCKKHKGFIEEFDAKSLVNGTASLGYKTLEDAYIAIADGHLDPTSLFEVLFQQKKTRAVTPQYERCVVDFSVNLADAASVDGVMSTWKRHNAAMKKMRFKPLANARRFVHWSLLLTPPEQQEIISELQAAGATNISLQKAYEQRKFLYLLLGTTMLWGLDPVVAHRLLATVITPLDLTLLRFLAFFASTACFYFIQSRLAQQKFKPLTLRDRWLFLSAISLFATALGTYFALWYISPTQYILFILAGTTVPSVLDALFHGTKKKMPVAAFAALSLTILAMMAMQGTSLVGVASAVLASLGFTLYSLFNKYYQLHTARVQARYAAFLFWLASILLPLSLLLIPWTHISTLSLPVILGSVAFLLLFTTVPYGLFYALLLQKDTYKLGEVLLLTAVPTVVAESVLSHSLYPLITLPILLGVFAQQWRSAKE
ncbi:MAG: HD domain-containing protein [Candidatus Peribacteraceae bacterium]|nr:HD domain-containing protein [Candidatus Peribacteraceae bacterium]